MASDESHFNVSLNVRDKVPRQCPQTPTFRRERRAEAESNRGPSAYQPNAFPLGQTGSLTRAARRCPVFVWLSVRQWMGLMARILWRYGGASRRAYPPTTATSGSCAALSSRMCVRAPRICATLHVTRASQTGSLCCWLVWRSSCWLTTTDIAFLN